MRQLMWIILIIGTGLAIYLIAEGKRAPSILPHKWVKFKDLLPVVLDYSEMYNVDPALVFAIMRQESGHGYKYQFDANAKRVEKGWWERYVKTGKCSICQKSKYKDDYTYWASYGVMQIFYPTALDLGFSPSENPHDLLDPQVSIYYGVKYLSKLQRRFGKYNYYDVISAYNSGRPFNQAPTSTKNIYVPNVVENYDFYDNELKKLNLKGII